MNQPYSQQKTDNLIIRTFSQNVHEDELVWHRDRNDREVRALGPTDWQFQLEDSIPQHLQDRIFIPKDTYHRLIKGTGDLDLSILEF